jgi:uncharacterized protein YceK
MKMASLILAVLILLSGCTSVPSVERTREVEKGVYTVRIPTDYGNTEEKTKYAINSFVKSKGGESYDAKLTNSPGFARDYYEYTITVPGSTPVEDLPKIKAHDRKKTELLLEIISIPIGIGLTAYVVVWVISGGGTAF